MIETAARHVRAALELLRAAPEASHAIAHLEAAAASLKPLRRRKLGDTRQPRKDGSKAR